MTENKFFDRLVSKQILTKIQIPSEDSITGKDTITGKERFIKSGASIFEIATSLKSRSYLSHYSALFVNGITTQMPKTIYITFEQSKKNSPKTTLTQQNIEAAFVKPQRKAEPVGFYQDYSFVILNGMHHNRVGVYTLNEVAVTNLERTLIDITVRPAYAGGVYSVLEAYERSIDKLSVNKLLAILDALDFTYPYVQAIGFYLQRAGYQGKKMEELKSRISTLDFYLTYAMEEKGYDPLWKLYYPKGM